jgi:hypothetical protein
LLIAVTLALPAHAATATATATACIVLSDAAGDAALSTVTSVGGQLDGSLDLLQATFEGTGTTLRVELHVGDSNDMPAGRTWTVSFSDGESAYALVASQQLDGNAFNAFGPGAYRGGSEASSLPPLSTVDGSIDLARGVVRFDAPLRALGLSPRARFQMFGGSSGRSVGTTGGLLAGTPVAGLSRTLTQETTVVSDQASGARNYRIDRGCRPFS